MHNLSPEMWASAAVLVGAYILIFTEVLHRTTAAILGAVVMVAVGMAMGFYTQQAAILAIDGNTILLLAAMMMLVAMLAMQVQTVLLPLMGVCRILWCRQKSSFVTKVAVGICHMTLLSCPLIVK